jgi:glucose-6-phosphate isomerase
VLIALFERAVGFYATLINLNAYHQPGVQAGKLAADRVLALQEAILKFLAKHKGRPQKLEAIAAGIKARGEIETVFKICEHLAANPDRGITKRAGKTPTATAYSQQ